MCVKMEVSVCLLFLLLSGYDEMGLRRRRRMTMLLLMLLLLWDRHES